MKVALPEFLIVHHSLRKPLCIWRPAPKETINEKRTRHLYIANGSLRHCFGQKSELSGRDQPAKSRETDRFIRHLQHWSGTRNYHRRNRTLRRIDDGAARGLHVDDAHGMGIRDCAGSPRLRRPRDGAHTHSWLADNASQHAAFYRHALRVVVLSGAGTLHPS